MVFDRVSYWSRLFINECFVGFFFCSTSAVSGLAYAQLNYSPLRSGQRQAIHVGTLGIH